MFHPSEVELARDDPQRCSTRSSGCKPTRVVFDSLSEMRLLARELAALPAADPRAEAVLHRPATARCCCSTTARRHDGDLQLQSLAHGVIALEQLAPELRRPSGGGCGCMKLRGRRTSAAATTTSASRTGGLEVFPRLVAAEHRRRLTRRSRLASGVAGARRPAGRRPRPRHQHAARSGRRASASRRSSAQYVAAAARRAASSAAIFIFDESAGHAGSPAPSGSAWTSRGHVEAGRITSARSTRPSCRRASSPTTSAAAVEDGRRADRGDRQPQRLPARHAGGAVPARSSSTSCSPTSASRAC